MELELLKILEGVDLVLELSELVNLKVTVPVELECPVESEGLVVGSVELDIDEVLLELVGEGPVDENLKLFQIFNFFLNN